MFEELKDNYLRKYKELRKVYDLRGVCPEENIDSYYHAVALDLKKGESYWDKWGNLTDLQYWIDDISEALDMENVKEELEPVDMGWMQQESMLFANQLVHIG